jgi:hypothetical protein
MFKQIIRGILRRYGYDIVRDDSRTFPKDFCDEDIEIIRKVRSFTMTSPERIWSLIQAVRYVVSANVPGAIVECGVWKGGSMMAVAHTLAQLKEQSRDLYLFDTFEGMTKPGVRDVDLSGKAAGRTFEKRNLSQDSSDWAYATMDEVRNAMVGTNYDADRIHLIKGKVEDTIPASAPDEIALLRLDTDWYESTRHELVHLFPRLACGGILIVDDYGHWQGCKEAVDEYVRSHNVKIFLSRIDYTGRLGVKAY